MKKMFLWCACAGILFSVNAETIDLNGVARTLTSTDDLTSATTYTNTGDTIVDLTITADTAEKLVVDSAISGNIRVVKEGDGRLRLNAANTYVGGTLWKAGYLEAGTTAAFGAAKTTVICQTSGSERYFHLLAAGEYDYNFEFDNSNTILWQTYDGINVVGDITGSTSGTLWIIGSGEGSRTFKNITLPNATLGFGASTLTVTNDVTVNKIITTTCYGKKDWKDTTYEAWKAASKKTRANPGTLQLKGAKNTFASFEGAYASIAVSQPKSLSDSLCLTWDAVCYNVSSFAMTAADQVISHLDCATTEDADSLNYRTVTSTAPVTLTLNGTKSATTVARLDNQVSIVYAPMNDNFTQAFVGDRKHGTSGTLTAKRGTLELGGVTEWANLTGLRALDGSTVAVTTTAETPFDATKLEVRIEGSGAIRTDRALMVRSALVDDVLLDPDVYTEANCTWVKGEGAITVLQQNITLTSADFADYAEKTITIPAGGVLSIDIAADEDLPFAGRIVGEGAVHVTGAGTLTLTGDNSFTGGLVFAGTGRLYAGSDTAFGAKTSTVTVTMPNSSLGFKDTVNTCYNPIDITATTGKSYLRFELKTKAKVFDIFSTITTMAPTTYVMRDTTGNCNDGECVVNFRGPIDASDKIFGKSQTVHNVNEFMTLNFYGKITCALFYQDPSKWGYGHFHFYAVNEIAEVSPAIKIFHSHADDCWAGAILSGDYERTDYQPDYGFDFHGHSMEVAGFCSYDYALTDPWIMTLESTEKPMTLTVTGEGVYNAPKDNGGRTTAKLNAGVSLVWAPVLTGPYKGKGILYNSTHATEGTITVTTGTLSTEGAVKFTNLSGITVRSGATFELNTTMSSALPKLNDLLVEAGGTFRVTEGETPFTDNLTTLYVGDDTASVELPANTTLKVGGLSTNGVFVADGTYSPTWLKGTDVKIEVTNKNLWLGPKGGSWGAAANWAVAVPSAAQPGYVHAGAADVQAVVDATASVGQVEILTKGGGKATVTVQTPLTVAADKVVTIGDRGTLDVAEGGSFVAGPMTTAGKVEVLAGGKLVLGSGDSSVRVDPGAEEHGLVVNAGGELSVTGGTLRIGHTKSTSWAQQSILFQKGGDINVSNDAQVQFDFGTYQNCDCQFVAFGTGKTVFSGSSKLTYADGTRNKHGPCFTPVNAGETCEVLFKDEATVSHPESFVGNMFIVGQTQGGTARLTFDGTGTSKGGYTTYVGDGFGRGEIYVKGGTLDLSYCGLEVGGGYERSGSGIMWTYDSDGYVEVCGGTLKISVSEISSYVNKIHGLNLGMGAAVCYQDDGVTPVPSKWKGLLKLTSGTLLNDAQVATVVGSGLGEGYVEQTGGSFEHNATALRYPVIVGFVGGAGDWTMSGGSADVKSCFYVGGVTTNELGVFVNNGTNNRIFPADWHTAKGRLSLSGGRMTISRDLVLSADGQGTLVLKPGCNLAVQGCLDARAGSKLVIDCRGYEGRAKTLATFGGTTTAFDDVTILQDGDVYAVDVKPTRIRVKLANPLGAMLLVR